jgi:hypothetical protein
VVTASPGSGNTSSAFSVQHVAIDTPTQHADNFVFGATDSHGAGMIDSASHAAGAGYTVTPDHTATFSINPHQDPNHH